MSNFKKLPKYIRCACIVILTLPSAIVAYYIVGYTYYLVAWLFLPGDYYVYAKDCEIYATGRITRSLQVFKEEDGILYFIDNYGFWTLDCVTDNIKMFNSTLTNEDIQELQTVQPLTVKEKGFNSDLKEPKDKNDKVYYGVFDFGGGTTDFDFGIWKNSEDEDEYDYELEHFGAGGDIHLGGENILKELAYKVFSNNTSKLRESKIQYVRPEWCPEISGEETLVENTREAKLNTRKLAEEKLRDIWEEKSTERIDNLSINLFNADGVLETGIDLKVNEEELKNLIKDKIEKGIKNFFIKLEDAFKDEDAKEINIFLAGNSCKHPFVNEIFAEYQEKLKDKIKLNLYDLKAIEGLKEKDSTKVSPTGKTGVAYGLIYSRNSGRIKVISRDEKANLDNEINFKFYVGNNRRNKFNCIISPNSSYDEYKYFGIVKSDIFELYYSTSPEAQTNEMKSSEAKIKRVNLKKEYDEEDRYRIYFKITEVETLEYVIVENEDGIEIKEFIEEEKHCL